MEVQPLVADDLADKEADKLRKTMTDKIDRIKDAIDTAEKATASAWWVNSKRGWSAVSLTGLGRWP